MPGTNPSTAPVATTEPTATAALPPSVAPTRPATQEPTGLERWSFARIVIPELNVREGPSTSARVLDKCCPIDGDPARPLRYGTKSGIDDVFILDGPVLADGFRWWRIGPTEYIWNIDEETGAPILLPAPGVEEEDLGWVADGDAEDSWLVPVASPCPGMPVETAEVTGKTASWAVTLGCFRDQVLTFRGWYGVDAGWEWVSPAIFPVERHWADPENHDRLDFRVFPTDLPLPTVSGWLDITGQFDHPSSSSCDSWEVIECRSTFTATEIEIVSR